MKKGSYWVQQRAARGYLGREEPKEDIIMIGRVKEKPKDEDKKNQLERGEVPKRKDYGAIRKVIRCPESPR